MNESLTTPKTPTRKSKGKKKPTAMKPDPAAFLDRETGFEAVHDAVEELRDFVQSVDAWYAEDCLRALANLGLIQRFVTRVDHGRNHVMLEADNPLDHALNRLFGPLV